METVTLSQTQQGADRQTAWGAREKGGSGSNLLSFSKLKKKAAKLRPAKSQSFQNAMEKHIVQDSRL